MAEVILKIFGTFLIINSLFAVPIIFIASIYVINRRYSHTGQRVKYILTCIGLYGLFIGTPILLELFWFIANISGCGYYQSVDSYDREISKNLLMVLTSNYFLISGECFYMYLVNKVFHPEMTGVSHTLKNVLKVYFLSTIVLVLVTVQIASSIDKHFDSLREGTNHPRYILKPVKLPPFQIEISDTEGTHTLKCIIWIGYSDKKIADPDTFSKELDDRKTQIHEIVFKRLHSKTPDELQYKNLDIVEDEILSDINRVLKRGTIEDIMFEEYIFQ